MEMREENRVIVKEGLKLLSQTPNLGMQALIRMTELKDKPLTFYHAGFILGPSINACGRLDSAGVVLRMLCTADEREALEYASRCKGFNDSRKELTENGVKESLKQLGEKDTDKVVVVYLPDMHESVAGIVAGRLRENCHRPVFVLTDAAEGVKGSGRSIPAYNMYEHMNACRDLFTKFGGHEGAAGLSMKKEDIPELRRRLNEGCELTKEDFLEKRYIDVPMPVSYVTPKLVKEFDLLEPCGKGNERPLFAQKDMLVVKGDVLGKNKNVLKLTMDIGSGEKREMMLFKELDRFQKFVDQKFGEGSYGALINGNKSLKMNVAYYPQLGEFRGNEQLEFVVVDFC